MRQISLALLAAALLAAALLAPSLARASGPATGEGLVVRLEPGYALWQLDAKNIESQVGPLAVEVPAKMVGEVQNAFGLTLAIGYDILGHATVGLEISGTGWNVGSANRGGAGFVSFTAAWHPVRLFDKRGASRRPWDASIFFGAGWGVVGEDRAMRGLFLTLGARAEYFPKPWFSVGLSIRMNPLMFSRYVTDWNAGAGVDLPKGSGGDLLVPALTIALHAPLGGS